MIADALKGKTILITGSTGFLGKSIVEKCLRSIPDIALINLAIRSSARRPAADRLEREVLSSPAFKRLKEELGEEYITPSMFDSRVVPAVAAAVAEAAIKTGVARRKSRGATVAASR